MNASYALPFCPADLFPLLWFNIERHLQPGGRFAGHFFGPKDDWANEPGITPHTRSEVESLFEGWQLERFEEIEEDSKSRLGPVKHWHYFEVIAVRG